MSETVNQEATANATQEKTFTQAEVNALVEGRLARAAEKYANYDELAQKAARLDELEEQSKTELQKVTERAEKLQRELDGMKEADKLRSVREKVAQETGVPVSLLTGDTEEACKKQAEGIKEYATPKYPNVKDGGEVNINSKGSTREQFAAWMAAQGK